MLLVLVDLSKLNDVVKNYVVKKDAYNAKIKNIEDKIPDITNLVTKTTLNAKINEVKGETLSITNLVTKTVLNAIENKIPSVNYWVKKTDYKLKINEIEKKLTDHNKYDKYITTQEFTKLTAERFTASSKWANLVTKSDFDYKPRNFNKRITSNKAKYVGVEKKLHCLITKDYNFFLGRSYFASNDGSQPTSNVLGLKIDKGTAYIIGWKLKG